MVRSFGRRGFASAIATIALVFSPTPSTRAAPATAKPSSIPARTCDVTRYGAKGTRVFLDTEAFQRAIDDCARKGGGTVLVPRGEYLIGPIFLKSNIDLHLAQWSELVGITDEAPYKVTDVTKAYVTNADWIALINIADAQNVSITGGGRIDGQGQSWWDRWRAQARKNMKGGGTNRPRLVHAARSRNLNFDGVGLYNSPSFHLVVKDSEDIRVNGMRFVALAHSPNTDAIDPIDVRNMTITNNVFDVGDDVVAIKSMKRNPARPDAAVENIVIRGNKGFAGRGICIGSETIGGVRNVLVEDNDLTGSMYGIRIKTPPGRGGLVQDIVFRNNRMTDVETPMVFSGYYEGAGYDETAVAAQLAAKGGFVLGHQIYPADTDAQQPYQAGSTPWIRNVRVEGLRAVGADRAGIVVGVPERPIEGLVFKDVRVESRRGLLIRNAEVDARGLRVRATGGKALIEENGATGRR
ncbi:glycoside hydrolase family 28 protein [Allosphingosinicella deserti]|uniref:Exo-poly-alpha-D-galacturonosidase n=1 Tax=Allosphingosinicella deserti TaxID=2116704 RepID=A0A2P7QNA9_9SPHN|nr:glycosyl hydrolase family 28 protein [Sphingomonas deserti]PSJ39434.1 exo-poly-alpha-D-galacturonosidase [Sphingomonas deserti]